jgi:hypothetical protein
MYNETAVANMNFAGVPGMVARSIMTATTCKIVDDINYYGHKGQRVIHLPCDRTFIMDFTKEPEMTKVNVNGVEYNNLVFTVDCQFRYPAEDRASLKEIKESVKKILSK